MAIQQCVGALSTPTRQLSKADKRLAKKLEQFDVLPENAFVDGKVVCAVCDRSPSSIQRDVKAGRLAAPIKIGPNAVRWRVGDVRRRIEASTTLDDTQPQTSSLLGPNGSSPLDDDAKQNGTLVTTGLSQKIGAGHE
jgi:predicted DNA-binding transcriptional regulator AlpA